MNDRVPRNRTKEKLIVAASMVDDLPIFHDDVFGGRRAIPKFAFQQQSLQLASGVKYAYCESGAHVENLLALRSRSHAALNGLSMQVRFTGEATRSGARLCA